MVIIAGSTRAVCWSLPTETSASANNGHRRTVMLELSRRAIIGIDYPSDGIVAACGRIARKSNVYGSYCRRTLDSSNETCADYNETLFEFARVTRAVEGALRRCLLTAIAGPRRHTHAYRLCIICIKPCANKKRSNDKESISQALALRFFSFPIIESKLINKRIMRK